MYNVIVNVEKTKFANLNRDEDQRKTIKNGDPMLGDKEDILRRKRLSQNAISTLTQIWKRRGQAQDYDEIEALFLFYKILVKSYCETWALANTNEEKLVAFQRNG